MKAVATVGVALLLILGAGCTTTEIKNLESRLSAVETDVGYLKAVAHEPHSKTKLLPGGSQ